MTKTRAAFVSKYPVDGKPESSTPGKRVTFADIIKEGSVFL